MAQIVTFGEIMLRLSTPGYQRFSQAASFDITLGGGEANVAIACANFGHQASFVSALPDNEIANTALRKLGFWGVDTSHVQRTGKRIGVYYLETGIYQRPSSVIYDRADSSMATVAPESFDWEAILQNADWFHCTGITPALSLSAAAANGNALCVARRLGVKTSMDLNFRTKLWSAAEARRAIEPMLENVDLLIGGVTQFQEVFAIEANEPSAVGFEMQKRYGIPRILISLRRSDANDLHFRSACLVCEGQARHTREFAFRIIESIGGGDAFCGGVISALLHGREPIAAVEFGIGSACLKHSIPGDSNKVTTAEVDAFLSSTVTGAVAR